MQPTRTERFLRIFTEVRPGEGVTAIVMVSNVFLILCAYYFVKPLREGWLAVSEIEGISKMEVKAYSAFGQSLLLLPVVTLYGRLASRMHRATLISRATLFCMSNMLLFWVLQPGFFLGHLPGTGIAFYLWVGMFGVFVVAQFWAFAADLYGDAQGKRLLPLIAIGATGGAWAGSTLTETLLDAGWLRTESLLLVAQAPLLVSVFLTRWADRRGPGGEPSSGSMPAPTQGPMPEGPLPGSVATVLRSPYLLAVGVITLLMAWTNTTGETVLFRVVQDTLAEEASEARITGDALVDFTKAGTTAFYADFFSWVNLCALLLQALVASRLLKYGGFGAILMLMPSIALLSYATMAVLPVLAVVKLMKIAENSTDYSVNNTARHVLWLPVSAEEKFKGKPTIDTLFVRVGDGLSAGTVLVGQRVLSLATVGYFALNVALVVIWIAVAVFVVREHGRLSHEEAET